MTKPARHTYTSWRMETPACLHFRSAVTVHVRMISKCESIIAKCNMEDMPARRSTQPENGPRRGRDNQSRLAEWLLRFHFAIRIWQLSICHWLLLRTVTVELLIGPLRPNGQECPSSGSAALLLLPLPRIEPTQIEQVT
jgi:hypothetical protein